MCWRRRNVCVTIHLTGPRGLARQLSAEFAGVVHDYQMNRVAQFPPSALLAIVWSLGRSQLADQELVKAAVSSIVVDELEPIEHCQLLQTLGDTLCQDQKYFNALAQYVVARKKGCLKNPKFINIVAKTCSLVRYYHSDMMDCLADAALEQLSSLSASGLDSIGHAFSHVNHIRRDLLLVII